MDGDDFLTVFGRPRGRPRGRARPTAGLCAGARSTTGHALVEVGRGDVDAIEEGFIAEEDREGDDGDPVAPGHKGRGRSQVESVTIRTVINDQVPTRDSITSAGKPVE